MSDAVGLVVADGAEWSEPTQPDLNGTQAAIRAG